MWPFFKDSKLRKYLKLSVCYFSQEKAKEKDNKQKEKQQPDQTPPTLQEPQQPEQQPKQDEEAPPPVPVHLNLDEDQTRILELVNKVESLELETRKTKDRLEECNVEKGALERDVATMKTDNDRLRTNNEAIMAEKWEVSAANTELKNRLQQSMAMSYMQVTWKMYSACNWQVFQSVFV
jgi:hypothetical protein